MGAPGRWLHAAVIGGDGFGEGESVRDGIGHAAEIAPAVDLFNAMERGAKIWGQGIRRSAPYLAPLCPSLSDDGVQ